MKIFTRPNGQRRPPQSIRPNLAATASCYQMTHIPLRTSCADVGSLSFDYCTNKQPPKPARRPTRALAPEFQGIHTFMWGKWRDVRPRILVSSARSSPVAQGAWQARASSTRSTRHHTCAARIHNNLLSATVACWTRARAWRCATSTGRVYQCASPRPPCRQLSMICKCRCTLVMRQNNPTKSWAALIRQPSSSACRSRRQARDDSCRA